MEHLTILPTSRKWCHLKRRDAKYKNKIPRIAKIANSIKPITSPFL